MATSSKNINGEAVSSELPALQNVKFKVFVETLQKLLRRGAFNNLKNILKKSHPADIVLIFRQLDPEEQWLLFEQIDDKATAAEVLSEMAGSELNFFVEHMSEAKLLELFAAMPEDDLASVLNELPEEKAEELLTKMKKDRSSEVEKLLNYGEDTAGSIMLPDFFALNEKVNVKEAIEALQQAEDKEMVFYIYVTDDGGHLIGVLSLRQLLTVPPTTPIKKIMNSHVVSVRTDMDQEEVARMVSRYNILAVPVVDATNKLVGIITVDDVIDVIREEATEDILKMAGAGDDFPSHRTLQSVRQRTPWLLFSCIGGLVALAIIGWFEDMLHTAIALAGFIPIIIGMSGNVGTQSSTLVVRGLAMKRIALGQLSKVLFREIRISLLMGCLYGLGLSLLTFFVYKTSPLLGPVVGVSLCLSMMVSATIGTSLPMMFQRLNIDPAIATGPFVTTATDILGLLIYLLIATALIPM